MDKSACLMQEGHEGVDGKTVHMQASVHTNADSLSVFVRPLACMYKGG